MLPKLGSGLLVCPVSKKACNDCVHDLTAKILNVIREQSAFFIKLGQRKKNNIYERQNMLTSPQGRDWLTKLFGLDK